LSPAWLRLLDEAASRSPELAMLGAGGPIVIEHVVSRVPGGEVRYRLVIDAAGARVHAGAEPEPARAARVTIESDYATASTLAQGRANAQSALEAGRWKVHGDLAGLAARREALDALDDVFASVRAATTYPPVEP
jgi:hypothetical protein